MSMRGTKRATGVRGRDEDPGTSKRRRTEPEDALWQLRPVSDLKMSSIYNRSASEAPAELFRKDLISAMKLPDSEPLTSSEYWVITDTWKQDWERGVQVPVNPDSLPAPKVKIIEKELPPDFQEFKLPKDKYIHLNRDAHFDPGLHQLSSTTARAEAACSYDLDATDLNWLKLLNAERARAGANPVSEDQLERVIEELEVRCWDKIQAIIKSEEGLGIEYDENVICDVCRSPDSEDGNEMVFCDSCNICVHQACYGITVIPPGQWLCRPCGDGVRPTCVLCPNLGGAMKCTPSGNKWAHVSCVLWIPEVSIGCAEKMEPITKISAIPASRWSLVCILCRERKGACIQCSVKTCKTAYHVTCAFKHGLEMRAIIEDENADDGVKLRSYCQKHSVNSKKDKCAGSGSEGEEEVKRKRRKDMTSEEKSQARAARLQEIEREFDRHVSVKDISTHLLDVDQDAINYIYNYWKVKRRAGHNRPLLPPKSDDSDLLSHRQEQADLDKMRMFVQLRQDLERVRNLCYMVSRREKLSRSFFRMREQTFHKQVAVLSADQDLSGPDLAAIVEANHGPSIYDRLYSHPNAPDHKNDFEELLARIAGPESGDEKTKKDLNGLVKGGKSSNPYKKHYVNGSTRRSGSMYSGLSSEESAPEISRSAGKYRGRAIGSSTDDESPKRKGTSPKKKVSPKATVKGKKSPKKGAKKRQPQSKAIIETSSEEESIKTRLTKKDLQKDRSRSKTLQQMEQEMAAGKAGIQSGSDSDELMPIRTTRNSKLPIDTIYSDSSENETTVKAEDVASDKSPNATNDSQQPLPRTKAAMKEFIPTQPVQKIEKTETKEVKKRGRKPSSSKEKKSVSEEEPKPKEAKLSSYSKSKDNPTATDLIVPQRQAAKKASENMRSTTAAVKPKEEEKHTSGDDTKPKPKIKPKKEDIKEVKEKETPAKDKEVSKRKTSSDVDKETIAYVPQRQAAKKAAAHIKSGLGSKPPTVEATDEKEKKKDTEKPELAKKSPKREEDKSSKSTQNSSSSSSTNSSSSSCSSSSSSEDEEEKPEAKPMVKAREIKPARQPSLFSPSGPRPTVDLPFLFRVSRPLSSTSASSDSDSSQGSRFSGSGSPTPKRPRRRRKNKSISTDGSPRKAPDKKLKTSERRSECGDPSPVAEGDEPVRAGARAAMRARTRSTAASGNLSHQLDAGQRKPPKDSDAHANKTPKETPKSSQLPTPERKTDEALTKHKLESPKAEPAKTDTKERSRGKRRSVSAEEKPIVEIDPPKSSPQKDEPKRRSLSSRRMSVKEPSNTEHHRESASIKDRRESVSIKERRESVSIKERRETASVKEKRESATIKERRESASIKERRESASVKERRENASVKDTRESASIKERRESASIRDRRESASIKERRESALVKERRENASVKETRESASIKERRESASIRERRESASIRERRESASIRERRESASIKEPRESASIKERPESASIKERRESASIMERLESASIKQRRESALIKEQRESALIKERYENDLIKERRECATIKERRLSRLESHNATEVSQKISSPNKKTTPRKSVEPERKLSPIKINDDYQDDTDKPWFQKVPSPANQPPIEKQGIHDKYSSEDRSMDSDSIDKTSIKMIAKIQATLNENTMIRSPKTPMDARTNTLDLADVEHHLGRNIRKRSALDTDKKFINQDHCQGVEISKSAKIPSAVNPFPNRSMFSPQKENDMFEFGMLAVDDEIMKPFTSYPDPFFFKEDSKEQGVQETLNLVDRLRMQLSTKKVSTENTDEPSAGFDDKEIEENENAPTNVSQNEQDFSADKDLGYASPTKEPYPAGNHVPGATPPVDLTPRDPATSQSNTQTSTTTEKWPNLPAAQTSQHIDRNDSKYDHNITYNEELKEPATVQSDMQSISEVDRDTVSKQSDDSQSLSVVDHSVHSNDQESITQDNQNYDNNNSLIHSDCATISSPYGSQQSKWQESKITQRRSSASSTNSEGSVCSQKAMHDKSHLNSLQQHPGQVAHSMAGMETYPAVPSYLEPPMSLSGYSGYPDASPFMTGMSLFGSGPLASPAPLFAPVPFAAPPLVPPTMPLCAAFTSSSQNMALTTAMIAPPTPKPAPSPSPPPPRDDPDTHAADTPSEASVHVVSSSPSVDSFNEIPSVKLANKTTNENSNETVASLTPTTVLEVKSPAKSIKSQKGKSPGKSPGFSPKSETQKSKRPSNRSNRGQRGRGRSKSRGQGFPPHVDYMGNSIQSKLVGTVYDFDEEIANDGVDLKALRDRRKSVDIHDRKTETSYKDASLSPVVASPQQNKRTPVVESKDPATDEASSPAGKGTPLTTVVAPVLPGPVDMRTYQPFETTAPAATDALHSHLLAFASGTADQQLADIDEEIEKQLHSALMASKPEPPAPPVPAAPEPPPAPPPPQLPKVSLSDSRNQLKVKIKGPFLDANYSSSVQPSAPAPPAPAHDTPTAAASTMSGGGNLRRMRKKELLRQYWTQDMNMDDPTAPVAPPPAVPVVVGRAVITIPKAVASMTSIPTREDYKISDSQVVDKKKRKTTSGLSRELRHLEVSMNDEVEGGSVQLQEPRVDPVHVHKRRGRVSGKGSKTSATAPATPKLKIKIGAGVVQPVADEPSGFQFRPPKKRFQKPSIEDLRRESMKFRRMVMANFEEDEKVKKHKPNKSEKRKKKKDKKAEKLQVVNSDSDSATKLIIKIKRNKEEEAGAGAAGSGAALAAAGGPVAEPPVDPFEYDPSAPDPLAIDPPSAYSDASSAMRKIRTAKVTPIRLKISRSTEGSGYVMKGSEQGPAAPATTSAPTLPLSVSKHCEVR